MRSCSSRGCLGRGDRDQLDLVELVLADHAARVAPGRAGLGAEARGQRGEAQRQLVLGEDLLAHEVGQRDFGGRDQPVARRVDLVEPCRSTSLSSTSTADLIELLDSSLRRKRSQNWSSSNFGSCAVPNIASSRTSSGGAHLGVAVLAGVQVEHELAERALQPRELALAAPRSARRRAWPRSRNPCRPSASPSSKCWLARRRRLRGDRRSGWRSTLPCLVRADRHVGRRQVRDRGERVVAAPRPPRAPRASSAGTLVLQARDLGHQRRRARLVLARLGLADLLGSGVAALLRRPAAPRSAACGALVEADQRRGQRLAARASRRPPSKPSGFSRMGGCRAWVRTDRDADRRARLGGLAGAADGPLGPLAAARAASRFRALLLDQRHREDRHFVEKQGRDRKRELADDVRRRQHGRHDEDDDDGVAALRLAGTPSR